MAVSDADVRSLIDRVSDYLAEYEGGGIIGRDHSRFYRALKEICEEVLEDRATIAAPAAELEKLREHEQKLTQYLISNTRYAERRMGEVTGVAARAYQSGAKDALTFLSEWIAEGYPQPPSSDKDLAHVCRELGCSGMSADCPGDSSCAILRKLTNPLSSSEEARHD